MPVVDGFIKLPPDSTGKAQDFSVVTTSQGSVLRERVNIADSISNNFANVSVAGALQVDGSGVTQPVSIAAAIDVSDRAARLVGHVAVDSLPAVDVTDRAARLVGHVTVDNFPATQPVSGTVAVTQGTSPWVAQDSADAASGAVLPSLFGAIAGSDYGVPAHVQPLKVDASGQLYIGNFPATQPVSGTVTANQGGAPWSVTFPAAQHVIVDSAPTTAVTQGTSPWVVSGTVTASQGGAPWSVDVTDRAARLLGVVYGSQAQQLKQTAVNFNLQVELAAGATLYDARQVRALTSADVVTAAQGAAAALNSKWPVQITDGTNTMPTGDAAARTIHVTVDNASIAVTGTVTANQGGAPWSVSFPAAQHVIVDTAPTTAVTQGTSPWVDNVSQFGGSPVVTGAGASGAGIPRVTVSNDSSVDVTDRSARLVGHVTVDSMPPITTSSSPTSVLDEYGNKISVAEDTLPWQQALLDEMRAMRMGMQVLIEYVNPASGISTQQNASAAQIRVPIVASLVHSEVDLIAWAQSIRDGADEVIQG